MAQTSPLETSEARVLAQWLQVHGIVFAHPANEGRRSFAARRSLKAEGFAAGLPDYLIFSKPPRWPTARGVAIELKRADASPSDLKDDQRGWLERLGGCGWICHVAKGADDAINALETLGFGRSRW